MPDLLGGGQPEGAELFIRPERIDIRRAQDAEGEVVSTRFLGSIQRVEVLWRAQPLLVETSSAVGLAAGDRVDLSFAAQDCAWVQA
ncbi:TOBE domain-containing protein [Pluralibacter gergoviae]